LKLFEQKFGNTDSFAIWND